MLIVNVDHHQANMIEGFFAKEYNLHRGPLVYARYRVYIPHFHNHQLMFFGQAGDKAGTLTFKNVKVEYPQLHVLTIITSEAGSVLYLPERQKVPNSFNMLVQNGQVLILPIDIKSPVERYVCL